MSAEQSNPLAHRLAWKRVRHVDPLNRREWHYVASKYRVEPLVDRRWFLFGRHSRSTYGTPLEA